MLNVSLKFNTVGHKGMRLLLVINGCLALSACSRLSSPDAAANNNLSSAEAMTAVARSSALIPSLPAGVSAAKVQVAQPQIKLAAGESGYIGNPTNQNSDKGQYVPGPSTTTTSTVAAVIPVMTTTSTVTTIPVATTTSTMAPAPVVTTTTSTLAPNKYSDAVPKPVVTVPQWSGIRQFGSALAYVNPFASATDSSGAVYVAGRTNRPLSGQVQQGAWDLFLTKYDNVGNLAWSVQRGGIPGSTTEARAVAIDAKSGNIYVAGHTSQHQDGTSHYPYEAFVAQYDAQGHLNWMKNLGGKLDETNSMGTMASSVAVNSAGEVVMAGYTQLPLASNVMSGHQDVFVAKMDRQGNVQWVYQMGAQDTIPNASGIAIDSNNAIYLVGNTMLTGALLVQGGGSVKSFIAKLDDQSSGASLNWLKELGPNANFALKGLAIAPQGEVIVFGDTNLGADGLPQISGRNLLLAKYQASNGNLIWYQQDQLATQSTTTNASAVTVNAQGGIFVAGQVLVLPASRREIKQQVFVAGYQDNGGSVNRLWVSQLAPASASIWSSAIALDAASNVFVGGTTGVALGSNVQIGDFDSFVAKYDSLGNLK